MPGDDFASCLGSTGLDIDPVVPGRPSRQFVPPETRLRRRIRILLDVASLLAVVTGLAICLRARSNARFGPLLGLVIPVGRLLLSADYRRRVEAAVFRTWGQVQQFSRGQGPIPWLAAVAFVSLPFFLLDLVHRGSLGTFDTRPVIPTAASLVREGNWDLSEFDQARPRSLLRDSDGQFHYCFQEAGGRIVSTFPSGMVPFALAVVAPAYYCGADLDYEKNLQHLVLISAWWDWPGGYRWGSRLLTDILPLPGLLALPAVALMFESRVGRGLLVGLALAGLFVHLPCLLWDAHRWNFLPDRDLWSWANAPFLYHPPN